MIVTFVLAVLTTVAIGIGCGWCAWASFDANFKAEKKVTWGNSVETGFLGLVTIAWLVVSTFSFVVPNWPW